MLAKILPNNHLMFSAENNINCISASVLKPLGINYFYYLRYYNDGSCHFLTTHSNAVKYVFEHNIPIAAPISEKLVKKKFNYFVLPIGDYNKWLHHTKINFNLDYFIDLVDRYDDYIELFCFGSTTKNAEIINFYLNNMELLEKFKFYFKDKAQNMLKYGEKNKIILPEIMRPPYQGLKCNIESIYKATSIHGFKNKYSSLSGKYRDIRLTRRQYDCLSQLAAGYTAKEAANNLGISHRTIENYLAHLKVKLDCHKKSQLIRIFLQYTTQVCDYQTD